MAYIKINKDKCKSCGVCVDVCPQNLIAVMEDELNVLGYRPVGFVGEDGSCKGCKLCAEMCPDICIEVYK
ncbi:MAG TPA: 4Fe-4S binding protein [bacterium]|nr:4Fe-4S binding protein [bacterium]